jgi:hypothetical protein
MINKAKSLGMYDLLISCGYENSIKVEDEIQIKKVTEKSNFS